ncbi:choline/ethanolamine kinase-like, partial [Onychostruthus taczanowskii]|uniref:choline/ethanolamine kinase-like n=1 Tax=Onychostruthus taczanowskii TaxID=356909 RepID=UPI001B8050F9
CPPVPSPVPSEPLSPIRDLLEATPSPVVFCHNDVQEGNILLLAGREGSSERLMLIDFEYSSYNYRWAWGSRGGIWGFTSVLRVPWGPFGVPGGPFGVPEGPFGAGRSPGVPLVSPGVPLGPGCPRGSRPHSHRCPQLHFIRHYLAELRAGPGRAPREEQQRLEEEMLREIERFALASHFFWGLWSVVQAKISTIRFGYLVSLGAAPAPLP